jgi:hypothetical protein
MIYYINLYILAHHVVVLYARTGAQAWWGVRLACMSDSLINHVTGPEDIVSTTVSLLTSAQCCNLFLSASDVKGYEI